MQLQLPPAAHHGARALVLAAFVLVAYWPSLGAPFVFDDFPNIVFNPDVRAERIGDLGRALHPDGINGQRLVAMASFALNHLVSGYDPVPYHAVNMAIHAANAVVLYLLVLMLARAPHSPDRLAANAQLFAFAAALVWAVHPLNTQAVTYIVQRMASLAALFYLLALLAFALWRSGSLRPRVAWSVIAAAFVLGLLTKAHVVTLPAALLLLDMALYRGWRRYHGWLLLGLAAAAIPVGLHFAGSAFTHLFSTAPGRDFSGYERLLTQGRVVWHYLSLVAWPEHGRLQLDYHFTVSRGILQPPITAVAWGALIAVTAAALAGLRRAPWPAMGWLFLGIALSVESSVIPLEMAFEHRMYLPSTLLIAGALAPLYAWLPAHGRSSGIAAVAVIALAGVLTLQTIARNTEWADQGQLWSADLERGASPYRSALNGSLALARQGRPDDALALLDHMPTQLEQVPAGKVAQTRGEVLMMLGRHEEALAAFREAIRHLPASRRAIYAAGQALLRLDRPAAARDVLEQLRRNAPESLFTAVLDAEIELAEGNAGEAERILRAFLERDDVAGNRGLNFVRLHLARVLRDMDRPEAAADEYRRVVESDPSQWSAWASLYHLLQAGGQREQAARIARYLEVHGVDPATWAPGDTPATGRAVPEGIGQEGE